MGWCRLDPKISRREIFLRIFALGIFWGGVSRYAAIPLIVALSLGHSDITRFRPWSAIATGNHLDRTEKIPEVAQTICTVDVFYLGSGILGPTMRRASACPNLHEWWIQPAHDLDETRRSFKISSWIWSIIYGVVTVLDRPGRHALQVEISPRLNWATQFSTVANDGACSPNGSVRMAWISFCALTCRKKRTWWQLASPCCWNRAHRLTCFLSAFVTRKYLQFGTWIDPSFQRHCRFRPKTPGSRSG